MPALLSNPARHLLMFIVPSIGFGALYVIQYDRPVHDAILHCGIIALLSGTLLAWLSLIPTQFSRWGRHSVTAAWALSWTALCLFYGACIASLHSWGRIPNSDLARSYIIQWRPFLETLGVEPTVAFAAVIVLTFALIGISWSIFWKGFPSRSSKLLPSLSVRAVAAVALTLISLLVLGPYLSGSHTTVSEPLQIVFGTNERDFRNREINHLDLLRLNEREQSQRSTLVPQEEAVTDRNIILIIVEGLRPDHLSVLGYQRETTPQLTRLRERAVDHLAGAGHSVCAESFCGILAVLASRYYSDLPSRPITISEVLKINGYTVRLLLSGDHSNFFALRELYGPNDQYWDGSMSNGSYINDDRALLHQVEKLPTSLPDPQMFYIHVMGPHLLATRYGTIKWAPEQRYGLSGSTAHGDGQVRSEPVVNFYDNGIAQADALIGNILEILDTKGYLDQALIIVTSDHGESLGEHGRFGHAKSVHEHALKVPMMIFSMDRPFSKPIRDRTLLSTVDISPTVLQEIGIEPPAIWQGAPLQIKRTNEIHFQQNHTCGVIWKDASHRLMKYWHTGDGNQQTLYNLTRDPHESLNLFKSDSSTYSAVEWSPTSMASRFDLEC